MLKVDVPLVIIAFNRPDLLKILMNKLKNITFEKVYFIVDGPRENHLTDHVKVDEVVKIIEATQFAVNRKVIRSMVNLGCKNRIVSGLSEVFSIEEKAIILEDDCIPSLSFFDYCESMLINFQNDKRIFQISGSNLLGTFETSNDIVFAETGTIWGWATWADRWATYDVNMTNFSKLSRDKPFIEAMKNLPGWKFRWKAFNSTFNGRIDTWDYQWIWARFVNRGLVVVPKYNLVENVGEGLDATNTVGQVGYRVQTYEGKSFSRLPLHFHPDKNFERMIWKLKIKNAFRKRLKLILNRL
jgi:hypothetical protein